MRWGLIMIFSNNLYLNWEGPWLFFFFYYLSTNIPACTAWTMLLNLGFSSGRRLATPIFLLKVHASQSRTSLGTDSACKSLSSSSVSNRRLQDREKHLSVTAGTENGEDLINCISIHQCLSVYSARPGLISVNSIQHGSSKLQIPAEVRQVQDTTVHLLQDPLQTDKTFTSTYNHVLSYWTIAHIVDRLPNTWGDEVNSIIIQSVQSLISYSGSIGPSFKWICVMVQINLYDN